MERNTLPTPASRTSVKGSLPREARAECRSRGASGRAVCDGGMMQGRGQIGKVSCSVRWQSPWRRRGGSSSIVVHPTRTRHMSELAFLPITELSRRIDAGMLDPRDLLQAYMQRVDGIGRALNCYVALCRENAVAAAGEAAQRAARHQRLGPLDGIPIGVKDNIDVAGLPTTNGFGGEHKPAAAAAEVIGRLRAAGAVILGKLNMQEGALGAVNDNPHHGRTTNPFRDGYTPGGSSGGSGAAVAAGLCAAALGTDTGGSVRIPAAYCGVVGMKPSYGLVSSRGVVPLSRRLDHVGPLTRTVADAALMLAAMAGHDPEWPYTRAYPAGFYSHLSSGSLDGVRLGVLANYEETRMQPAVWSAFGKALRLVEQLGAEIRTLRLPSYDIVRGRRALF